MSNIIIYHNPRCTKSRQTLSLLQEQKIEPKIVEYLKNPLSETEIRSLLKKLGLSAQQVIRKKDYKALGLPETENEAKLIQLMAENPKIIERPIVVAGRKAKLGRPPEQVLDIL